MDLMCTLCPALAMVPKSIYVLGTQRSTWFLPMLPFCVGPTRKNWLLLTAVEPCGFSHILRRNSGKIVNIFGLMTDSDSV